MQACAPMWVGGPNAMLVGSISGGFWRLPDSGLSDWWAAGAVWDCWVELGGRSVVGLWVDRWMV